MDRLEFFDREELLQFLRVKKTEISLLEKPQIFLNQLRDHNMIPEDRYKKVSRMRKNENVAKNMYELLEWVETEQKDHITLFWKCAFNHSIMNHYPKLQMMFKNLMDGSFRDVLLPAKVESEKSDQEKSQKASEGDQQGGENKANSVKKKRKQRVECVEDGEQPGPSCPQTPAQRTKRRKLSYFKTNPTSRMFALDTGRASPLKKGENNNIWEWPLYKSHLPVTCGNKKGTLSRSRLANGEKSILVDKKWYSPNQFQILGGKADTKNWKLSIRCQDTQLQKLIKEGHLKIKPCKGGRLKTHNTADNPSTGSSAPQVADNPSTDSEEDTDKSDQDDESQSSATSTVTNEENEEEEEAEEEEEGDPDLQPQISPDDSSTQVFKVTCGQLEGNLHMSRFASGNRGKSIRTEDSWLTPVEFLEKGLGHTDASSHWKKDIECDGQPLKVLIESKIHMLLCPCSRCDPSPTELKDQNNDDECSVCASMGKLVQCDDCPRSFHHKCHLPHVDDALCRAKKKDNPWYCTFCVYRRTREFYTHKELTMDAAKSSNMTQHLMECQYLFLRLCCADRLKTLAVNPTVSAPGSATAIGPPVSLGSVAKRLQEQPHKTVGEFVVDVQLIFSNSATFNRENAEMLNETARLLEFFEEDLRKVFNISS